MRDVYVTVNSMQSSGFVSHTNQKLFESIGPKALLFLAGLWTSNAPSVTAVSKYVALKHALAFLQAQQSAEVHVDFQVIIPSLICALQETDKRVRAAAMDCLSAIGSSAGGPKSSDVYAYDSVYGKSSGQTMLLCPKIMKFMLTPRQTHFSLWIPTTAYDMSRPSWNIVTI